MTYSIAELRGKALACEQLAERANGRATKDHWCAAAKRWRRLLRDEVSKLEGSTTQ